MNSLARAVGCCTLPMGFSRAGLAARAVLTLSHPLLAHSSVCLRSVHIQNPRMWGGDHLREVTKPLAQAGSPKAI